MLFRREDGVADFHDDLGDDAVTQRLEPSTSGGGVDASQSSGTPINCATQAGFRLPLPLARCAAACKTCCRRIPLAAFSAVLRSSSSGPRSISPSMRFGVGQPWRFPLALLLARSGGPASQESRIACAWMFGLCRWCWLGAFPSQRQSRACGLAHRPSCFRTSPASVVPPVWPGDGSSARCGPLLTVCVGHSMPFRAIASRPWSALPPVPFARPSAAFAVGQSEPGDNPHTLPAVWRPNVVSTHHERPAGVARRVQVSEHLVRCCSP